MIMLLLLIGNATYYALVDFDRIRQIVNGAFIDELYPSP